MPTRFFRIVLAISLLTFSIPITASSEGQIKTVVIFFSLDANVPAYNSFQKGFTEQLTPMTEQTYNVIIEYMDIRRFPDTTYLLEIVDRYNNKYKPVDIDLIITFGPNTLSILSNYGFDPKHGADIINIDIEDNIEANAYNVYIDKDKTLNIAIKADCRRSLEAAFDLFPECRDVYVVSGDSPADNYFSELLRRASVNFSQSHRFHFSTNTTLDSTLAFVRQIPENSIVFVTSYIEDSDHVPYTTTMASRIISTQCDAPIFTLADDFVEANAVGGYVYSFIALGRYTESLVEELINGASISDFSVDEYSFNKYMYDWNALVKWELEDSPVIPGGSELFNKYESFLTKYRWYLLAALIFVIVQSYLLLVLFRLYRRQAAVASQREKNELLYRQMVREDRHTRMSALAGSLSHELNQPLTAILYNAQAAQRFLSSGKLTDELASEILTNIIEDDKRAAGLISSLRGFMKLEVREHEQVDMNSIILDTLNIFHAETIAQHIEVRYQPSKEPVNVFGDKVQLQQVMLNLLFNAENAMADNGTTAKTIDIDLQCEKSSALITILDSGPGIKESIKDTLFKPFVTSTSSGMGIGLAISKSIVESHQGTIMVENHPKGGAQFSVKLPLFNHGA